MNKLNYLREEPRKYWFDACKLIYHQDKLQAFLDDKRIIPIHIDMGIHKNCNIRCIYCYGIKQKMSKKYIPEDRLMLLANDASQAGIRSIAIIGDGEPTLNSGLYPFVRRLKELSIDCAVATNGLLLNKARITTLVQSCKWLRFNISAVGGAYNRIHRGASIDDYTRLEEYIQYAVANKQDCTVGLQMVLIPQCFDQIIPLTKKAIAWGVDYLVIKQFSDPEEDIPIRFDINRYEEARQELELASKMSTDNTKIIIKWHAMQDSKSITMDRKWEFDRCIDLPFIFQISGDGGCYPCGYLFGNKKYCYGNITQESLYDILYSEHYWSIINTIARTPLENLCRGQCRHSETLKFMDRLLKENGSLHRRLVRMCGSKRQYNKIMNNPPEHINFI